jgi:hypothetical protein
VRYLTWGRAAFAAMLWPCTGIALAQSPPAAAAKTDSARAVEQGAPTAAAPVHDSVALGGRTIPAGETVVGPVVVAGGDLDVRGTIQGSAIAIAGDVILRNGGRVTGDAISAFGSVRVEGGTAGGAIRSITGRWGASLRSTAREHRAANRPPQSPVSLALGSFGVMMLIGLGVLVFANRYLDGVVDVLQDSFWRSFLVGIAGELGVIPAVVLLVVALAITVLGVLLIPFALVAFLLAVAGLFTLGFVAVARVTGDGVGARSVSRLSRRGGALRGVIVGVTIYMGIWLLAAALGGIPVASTVLRLLALLVTYVALTAGFGAALLSRGGTRRDAAVRAAPAPAMDAVGWQTPTPVTGVVAARRPNRTAAGAAPLDKRR